MKKLTLLLMSVVFMAVPVVFNSCNSKPDPDNPAGKDDGVTELKYITGMRMGDVSGMQNGCDNITIVFSTGTLTNTSDGLSGTGDLVQIQLFSPKVTDGFPKPGTYTSIVDDSQPFTALEGREQGGEATASNVIEVVDGVRGSFYLMSDIEVTVAGDKENARVTIKASLDNGKKIHCSYSGSLPVTDVTPGM